MHTRYGSGSVNCKHLFMIRRRLRFLYVRTVHYICIVKRHFNTHISGLDLEFWHDLIKSHGKFITLHKGEYLCRRGEPTKACGFVKSGYLVYKHHGLANIGGFAFADALCGDYPNCLHNAPALFDLVAGRKTELWVMDATLLNAMYAEDKYLCEQGRIFMESAYNSLLRRYCSLCAKTPAERYVDLIREHPQIEQDVPQKEIAKYLHISPIHLCRIRKELLSQL